MDYVIRMTYDATLSHPDDITKFEPKVIRMIHLLTASRPGDLWTLQYVIRITYEVSLRHPDDMA